MRKLLILLIVPTLSAAAVVSTSSVDTVQAATNMSRAEIKSMPITARPNRFGHFYGNAVRRRSS